MQLQDQEYMPKRHDDSAIAGTEADNSPLNIQVVNM
jgi:hypothetical protein